MAKKKLEDFQKLLDALVIQAERLKNAQEQAEKVANEFAAAGKSAEILEKANRKLAEAQYKYEEHMAALSSKQDEIKNQARMAGVDETKLNTATDSARYEEIMSQNNGGGGGMSSLFSKKGGAASVISNVVGGIFNLVSDIYIAEQKKSLSVWMQEQDIYLNAIETSGRIFQRNMKTFAKGMQGALSSSFASITQGVQEGAYAAAQNSADIGTEFLTNQLEKELDLFKQQMFAQLRAKKGEQERVNLNIQEINSIAGAVSGIANALPGWGQAIGGIVSSIASATTKIWAANTEIEVMKLEKEQEIAEKQLEIINEVKKAAIESSNAAVKQVLDFSKSIEVLSSKTDAAAKSMGNILGLSGSNIENYERFIYNAARNLYYTNSVGKTTYLDKTAEDMAKIQSEYVSTSNRNITMSRNDMIKTFLLGKELGDDNLAAALLGDMDYFNQTIENSTQMIHEMFIQANKAGVSNRKFAKDLQQNLKLAQKYTFKGGVEALMKMSIWAQKTRFNMQSLETIVDKITEGGIEGIIKQSAELQVLGGNMAVYSDPFGMMYEAFADPEALGKRYNKMLEGMGTFNKKTGQTEINMPDRLRLQAYAKATGISFQDAVNQVNQGVKNNQIDTYLKAGGGRQYTEAEKALIYSKAQYNTETGAWQVTDNRGNIIGDINNLSDEQINELMPVEERIEDHVSKIASWVEQQKGVTNFGQAVMSDETFDNLKKNINERMKENLSFVEDTTAKLKSMVEKSNDFVTTQNKQQHDLMIATSKLLDDQFAIIQKSTEKLKNEFLDSGSQLRLAIDAVRAQIEYELNPTEENRKKSDAAQDALVKGGLKITHDRSGKTTGDDRKNNYIKYLNGEGSRPSNDDIDYLKEHPEARKGMTNEQLKKLRKEDTRGWYNLWDWHRDTNWVEGKGEGDTNYRKGYSKGADEARRRQNKARVENDPFVNNAMVWGKDVVTSGNGNPMYTQASEITPISDGAVRIARTDPNDFGVFAKTGGPFDTLFNSVFKQINEVYNIVKKEAPATYFHSPSYDMRGTNESQNTSYGNDYVSTSNEINNTLTDIGQIVDEIYSFGDTIAKTANQSKVNNNVSNVVNTLEKITYPENNASISSVAYNRQNGDISDNDTNEYNQYYDSNSTQTTQIGDKSRQVQLGLPTNTDTQQYKVLEYITREIKNQNDKLVFSGDVRNESASVERYDSYSSNNVESILQNETLIDRFENVLRQFDSNGGINGKPIEVKFSGSIDLKSGGQSVDILNMMREDPYFIRTLAEMLALQYSSTINGGKSEMYGGNRYGLR